LSIDLVTFIYGFSAAPSSNGSADHALPRSDRPNFHQVLEQAGKTVFRPGGTEATNTIHAWADDLNDDSFVMELSGGLGTGGMALAASKGCRVLVTDQDENRLSEANRIAEQRELGDLISTQRVDMAKLDLEAPGKLLPLLRTGELFDAVIVEASLTHCPLILKEKILTDVGTLSKQVLLHEICLRGPIKDDESEEARRIKSQVGQSLAIGFHPLTVEGWRDLVTKCDYEITQLETGPIRFLNPITLVRDEGIIGASRVAWNLLVHSDLRDRILATKSLLVSHGETLGYIIIRAKKIRS
jgi:hypothetical protein